jgi:regulator of protease activity HflC (stomatin/prohibitin superfamily)
MNFTTALPLAIIVLIVAIWFYGCLNILRDYERGVVFRLGRAQAKEKGPGLVAILWPIEKLVKVSLRDVTLDVPPQDVLTHDNISVKIDAVVHFQVVSATQAVTTVENFRYAVEQAARASLGTVVGGVDLEELLAQRKKLNARLQTVLGKDAEPWGIRVTQAQIKQVDLPREMTRAIAAQAERERRTKMLER